MVPLQSDTVPLLLFISVPMLLMLIALNSIGSQPKKHSVKRNINHGIIWSLFLGYSAIVILNSFIIFPNNQKQKVDEAYGIEIVGNWPRRFDGPIITYEKDGKTFEGKLVIEDRTATIYAITTEGPLPLAQD